jgi:hypothetical protein
MNLRIASVAGVLAATVLGAAGCAGSVHEGMARSRAANEMGCSQADLRMVYLGSGGWVAEGCGQTMHLACNGYSGGDGFCVVENVPSPGPASDPSADDASRSARRALDNDGLESRR